MPQADLDVYQRADGKWSWRLKAGNGQIVATDGGQGYENHSDAIATAIAVTHGDYFRVDAEPPDDPVVDPEPDSG